jgi:prolyl-tRNA synthetase
VRHPQALLEEVQQSLLAEAAAFRDANIVDVATYDELKAAIADGKWARGPWAGPSFLHRAIRSMPLHSCCARQLMRIRP